MPRQGLVDTVDLIKSMFMKGSDEDRVLVSLPGDCEPAQLFAASLKQLGVAVPDCADSGGTSINTFAAQRAAVVTALRMQGEHGQYAVDFIRTRHGKPL